MTTELTTQNLAALYDLRTQEKAIKAQIERVKPLAIEEAKLIQPDGGKFSVDGAGVFVLDKDPILEKDPENPSDTAPDITTSRDEDAVNYRKRLREQSGYSAQAKALTKTIKGFYDAFKTKFAKRFTRFDYTLKCCLDEK